MGEEQRRPHLRGELTQVLVVPGRVHALEQRRHRARRRTSRCRSRHRSSWSRPAGSAGSGRSSSASVEKAGPRPGSGHRSTPSIGTCHHIPTPETVILHHRASFVRGSSELGLGISTLRGHRRPVSKGGPGKALRPTNTVPDGSTSGTRALCSYFLVVSALGRGYRPQFLPRAGRRSFDDEPPTAAPCRPADFDGPVRPCPGQGQAHLTDVGRPFVPVRGPDSLGFCIQVGTAVRRLGDGGHEKLPGGGHIAARWRT